MQNKLRQLIHLLMKKYFQWRYWSHLYRNMVKQVKSNNEQLNKELIPYMNKPGIALSFDDSYRVNDWYKYGKNIFGYYDVKVTFNMNGVHPLEENREHIQQEIDKLLELQANGHELAHHSFRHKDATEYSAAYGYDRWMEEEIITLFNWMEKQSHSKTKERFKKPVIFAFPHFKCNDLTLRKLIPKYFKIARGHLDKDNLTSFNHSGFAPSICLDTYYACNVNYLKKMIKLAKKTGKNLILTCHSILPENVNRDHIGKGKKAEKWGNWRVSPELIQRIIDIGRKYDMEFYTTSEIAGIATFIDYNFERAVREKISNPDRWIDIADLTKVKELDLSNKGISNLDGLEYFLNVEKLNLSNNSISDFRLLKKLPKLKHVNTENNSLDHSKNVKRYSSLVKSSFLLLALKVTPFVKVFHFPEWS
ncbi:polysaccharide deacetylase family protein [Heyndrickxia sp. NPDC080065]|uniref:polysaccharide deacetylase family protein n=1 Tax=Heyndrickxia sp. NPDC080065 TaxID=3390568 RepID=UPI003D07D354